MQLQWRNAVINEAYGKESPNSAPGGADSADMAAHGLEGADRALQGEAVDWLQDKREALKAMGEAGSQR